MSPATTVDTFSDLNSSTIDPHILDFIGNRWLLSKEGMRQLIEKAHKTPKSLTDRQNLALRSVRQMKKMVAELKANGESIIWARVAVRAVEAAKKGAGQPVSTTGPRTVHPKWEAPSTKTKLGDKCKKLRAKLSSGQAPYTMSGGTPQTRVLGVNITGIYPPGAIIKASWIKHAKEVCNVAKKGDKILADASVDPDQLMADADTLLNGGVPGETGPQYVPEGTVLDDGSTDEDGNPTGLLDGEILGFDKKIVLAVVVLAGAAVAYKQSR